MEEQEAPLEEVHEQIHHHAEHSKGGWIMGVALSTAVLAAIAAIASLLSGDHVNEAMLEQIKAADQWNYYQAKGIKAAELGTRIDLLQAIGKPAKPEDQKKLDDDRDKQEQVRAQAEELEKSAEAHMKRHHVIAKSVTWSQIAIAICAISVLTKQRWFWYVGLLFGLAGLVFLIWGAIL